MIQPVDPTSRAAFEAKYQEDPDPWNFASSSYERNRYQTILASLRQRRYERVFEPGCSIGELTAELACRSQTVIAADISPTAVARARARCAHLPNVEVVCSDVAHEMPNGPFDLIVMCEIGYYFPPPGLEALADRLVSRLAPQGELTAAHWLGTSADHLLHGDAVHALLGANPGLDWIAGSRATGFRVDTWLRRS